MEKHLLEDWEIKLMLDSVQQARCVSVHEANEIRNKLLNLTSQRGRSRFSHMIMPLPGNVRGVGQIGEYIEIMLEAMYLHKKIRFQYFQWNVKKEMELRHGGAYYHISPWGLSWDDENYYLIAYDSEAGIIKHYRVDKMLKIELSVEKREGKEQFQHFDIAAYSKKTFGMFAGKEETVTLRCDCSLTGVMIDHHAC